MPFKTNARNLNTLQATNCYDGCLQWQQEFIIGHFSIRNLRTFHFLFDRRLGFPYKQSS